MFWPVFFFFCGNDSGRTGKFSCAISLAEVHKISQLFSLVTQGLRGMTAAHPFLLEKPFTVMYRRAMLTSVTDRFIPYVSDAFER